MKSRTSRLKRYLIAGLLVWVPAGVTFLVLRISSLADHVIVKVPDSAGSAGNLRLDSDFVKQQSISDLRQFLLGRLHGMGWRDTYPLLVGVWDRNVICSPSAQLWLPLPSEGPPQLDGLFEQRVRTSKAMFVGAARSSLPDMVRTRIGSQALRIARVLQRLGYYGRCSLDAVLCQNASEPPTIHWIECNGRWGGVSIPLPAARQLTSEAPDLAISIVQEHVPDLYLRTGDLQDRLGSLLFRRGGALPGVVVMSPPEHPSGTRLNLMSLARSQKSADSALDAAVQILCEDRTM